MNIDREGLSESDIFMYLRERDIQQLGQVNEAYLERSGRLSLVRFEKGEIRRSLPISPPWEIEAPETYRPGDAAPYDDDYVCKYCGMTSRFSMGESLPPCTVCFQDGRAKKKTDMVGWVRASSAGMDSRSGA